MIHRIFEKTSVYIETPWFLILLPILIIVLIRGVMKRPPSLVIGALRPYALSISQKQMIFSPVRIPLLLEGIGMLCLIIALIRPQHGVEETIRRTEGIDIMLALDVSGSMQAYDIPSAVSDKNTVVRLLNSGQLKPRIDVAKEEVKNFIDKRPNDRIGVLGFAANTYTVCPPTLDHEFLKSHLDRLEAGILPDGTGIAAPIANSTTRLKDSKAKRRVLVLFTDGDNNVDAKITPQQASKIARMFDVIIHTVGIGSDRAFVVRKGFFGNQMLNVQDNFNRELLEDISAETKGRYFAARDGDGLRQVMTEIDSLEKTNIEQPTYIDYKELYRNWLTWGLSLIALGAILEHTICLRVP